MEQEPNATEPHTVDARGLWCPEPVVLARLALNACAPGTVVRVLSTDPLAPLDLEALCARSGHRYLHTSSFADGVQQTLLQHGSAA